MFLSRYALFSSQAVIYLYLFRQANMKIKTREEIRQEVLADYGQKSRAKILLSIIGILLLRLLLNNVFVALFTIGTSNLIPFILCLVIGNFQLLPISILFSLPAHYFLFWKSFNGSDDQLEINQMNDMMRTAAQELWVLFIKR